MNYGGLPWALAVQLMLAPVYAQTPSPLALKMTVAQGEGAIHNIHQRASRDVVVQVEDGNQRPAAGAAVTFMLPAQGAGGTFSEGRHTVTVTADQQGRATARGFRPNSVPGKVEIRANASWQGRTGRVMITQFNMLVENPGKKSHTGIIVAVLLIAGAAAAGGAVAVTRRSATQTPASTPPPPVLTITPGGGTITPPQ